ncbi:MAG TPA: hypothetical protein VNV60_07115 [Holophagaceae bacterium]|jgi:hypothetical protein|nr:hypothetical protein [Holophagaceae bacterium]
MGVFASIRQARWYMWIVVPLAVYGASNLLGEGAKFYWSWKRYQSERDIAVSNGLVIPTFREYRWDKYLQLDPVLGQLFAKSLCQSGERAIKELLPPEEQQAASDRLSKFREQTRLVNDADQMLIAERIDEIHLILKDPQRRTPDELRAWLGRVDEFTDMKARFGYKP